MKPLGKPFSDIIYASDFEWSEHYPDKFRARRAVMLHAVNLGWSLETCCLTIFNSGGYWVWSSGAW